MTMTDVPQSAAGHASRAAPASAPWLARRGLLLAAAGLLGLMPLGIPSVCAADATEGSIEVPGARLFYRSEGTGEPLLLIAGFSCDLTIWDALAPLLRERFRVIRFDNRGIGRSERTNAAASDISSLSIGQMAQDSLALLDALAVPRAHVLGHSMGAQIAQELSLHAGGRIATLSLLSSWAEPDGRFAWLIRLFGDLAGRIGPEQYARVLLPWMFTEVAFSAAPDAMEQAARQAASYPLRPKPALLQAQSRAILGNRTGGRLGRIAVPTLVGVAGGDALTPARLSRTIADAIPGARYAEINSGGHAFILDAAPRVAEQVASFLAAHPLAG
jgi:3-oxoadipate enol-lactonase